ncbi:hypothetical protein MT391_20275 [Vibrio sp. 1-Bac 57]
MDPIYLNLFSGLIGSIIGVLTTLIIAIINRRDSAVDNLLSRVHSIGFQIRYLSNENRPAPIFHEQFTELWIAYTALSKAVPYWRKKELRKAWRKFMVMENLFDDSTPDNWDVFKKGTHSSKEQAVLCCSEFIKYINKLN